nr:MBOAT family protein [Hufsiella ginkgonis]
MISYSLVLHFGILSISAGVWRLRGVNTWYLFNSPARSLTVGEFWSKRWNVAFSEMITIGVYRPVKKRAGTRIAVIAGFLFSGILHELAITLPVRSGYGLPLVYFFIQGLIVTGEKAGIKITGSIWTACCVVLPLPLLFPPLFTREIIWPLAGLTFPAT